MKRKLYPVLAAVMILLTALACASESASALNQGKGTRDDPVVARKYAKADNFDVRAQTVIRPLDLPLPDGEQAINEFMKVQYEIKCTQGRNQICNLGELRDKLKVIDDNGTVFTADITVMSPEQGDTPLAGEILGSSEETGWLLYKVPIGTHITMAVAQFGDGQNVFFKLP